MYNKDLSFRKFVLCPYVVNGKENKLLQIKSETLINKIDFEEKFTKNIVIIKIFSNMLEAKYLPQSFSG